MKRDITEKDLVGFLAYDIFLQNRTEFFMRFLNDPGLYGRLYNEAYRAYEILEYYRLLEDEENLPKSENEIN